MPPRIDKTSRNPLKNDEELAGLLDELDSIQDRRTFRRWKGSFLSRFETFLEKPGIEAAEKHYQQFSKSCKKFGASVHRVQSLEETYKSGSTGVKGRNALNELMKVLTETIEELQKLAPSTGAEEKKSGYTKYMLGAVLVRDDFEVYGILDECRDILKEMQTGCLAQVADKQLLDQIDYYVKGIGRFCDLMADLSLYDVMLKARRFSGEDDVLIFVDPKTGAVGELDRKVLVEKKILTMKVEGGKKTIEEAVHGKDKEALVDQLKVALRL